MLPSLSQPARAPSCPKRASGSLATPSRSMPPARARAPSQQGVFSPNFSQNAPASCRAVALARTLRSMFYCNRNTICMRAMRNPQSDPTPLCDDEHRSLYIVPLQLPPPSLASLLILISHAVAPRAKIRSPMVHGDVLTSFKPRNVASKATAARIRAARPHDIRPPRGVSPALRHTIRLSVQKCIAHSFAARALRWRMVAHVDEYVDGLRQLEIHHTVACLAPPCDAAPPRSPRQARGVDQGTRRSDTPPLKRCRAPRA